MSIELTLVVVAVALALAIITARTWVQRKGRLRREYSQLIGIAIFLGLVAGHALHLLFADAEDPWVTWPLGPLAGVALVELGGSVLAAMKAALKVVVDALRKRFGGG